MIRISYLLFSLFMLNIFRWSRHYKNALQICFWTKLIGLVGTKDTIATHIDSKTIADVYIILVNHVSMAIVYDVRGTTIIRIDFFKICRSNPSRLIFQGISISQFIGIFGFLFREWKKIICHKVSPFFPLFLLECGDHKKKR